MREGGAVATLAARECGEKLGDALAKIDGQNQNRAELDDDGIHFPVAAGEIDVQERLGKSFNDAQQDGQQIFVQNLSPGVVELLTTAAGPDFAGAGKILRIS